MKIDQFITSLVVLGVFFKVFLLGTAYLILLERKIAAWAQNRLGPNRVGLTFGFLPEKWHMFGFGQPLADGLKFMAKEDYNPGHVDRALFIAAPVLAAVPAIIAWAVIPWGGMLEAFTLAIPAGIPWVGGQIWNVGPVNIVVTEANIGVIYILAVGSLAVYGVTIGAWAANNKYAFLGGLRATAQMLSYEIPMGLCLICVLLLYGTVRADELIAAQIGYWGPLPMWGIFQHPFVAIMFFTCLLAEANRAPFDLAECEQELIGGFHTEYSSMKFALFFLGEYIHMIAGSAFFCVLFLGGWHLPWLDMLIYGEPQPVMTGIVGVVIKISVLLAKVLFLLAVMMWIRWTVPRFRFDQLMKLAWRCLIPVSIGLMMITGVFVYYGWEGYLWIANLIMVGATAIGQQLIPVDTNANARVPLKGSRFSPLAES